MVREIPWAYGLRDFLCNGKKERGKRKEERGKSCFDAVCFGVAPRSRKLYKLKFSLFIVC